MPIKNNKHEPFHKEFANKIIKMLEEGTAPWQKPWDCACYPMPHNPITGKRYRGTNMVKLSMSAIANDFADPRWLTFKQAQDNGWQVKKGSRGTSIIYYQFRSPKEKLDNEGSPVLDEDGNPVKENQHPIMRVHFVFNAEQIDGIPPLEVPEHEWTPVERAEEILSNSEAIIEHDQSDRAFYNCSTDEIHLPPKSSFPTPDKYYATALHELGHWTGHKSRLDREGGIFGSQEYAKEELRAEIASWMIGMETGIGHDPGQHAAYVESWVQILKDKPSEILRACRDAEKIREYVMSFENEPVFEEELISSGPAL